MATLTSDIFADLSLDIIHDVLHIGCPKLEDLELLERTEGRWGAAIRRGSLRRTKLEVSSKWKGDYTTERYEYGHSLTTMPLERLLGMKDWSVVQLTDLRFEVVDSTPMEALKRFFLHAVESVSVNLRNCKSDERRLEVLDLLSSCPITNLGIQFNRKYDYVALEKFESTLRNPTLRHLKLNECLFNKNDGIEPLMSFIKRPNFFRLDFLIDGEKMVEAVIEHWLQLTEFPSHVQCVRSELEVWGRKFNFYDKRFRKVATFDQRPMVEAQVYYLDHPNDDSKRIECFIYENNIVELCLTSKEASVWGEWGAYEEWQLRKSIHSLKFRDQVIKG